MDKNKQAAIACFIKHGDPKCPRCNRGLLYWSQMRSLKR